MLIRKYTTTDMPKIILLLRLNTPKYFAPEEEKDFLAYLKQDADNYYVIEENNIITGSGGFNLTEDRATGKISWDIIHPDCHGKGLGTKLMRFRIEQMKEIKSVNKISVRTSQLAYRFYEKFGLQLREVIKDYWASGFDLYRLDNDVDKVV